MKYELRLRRAARQDIQAARAWYERQVAGLGARFGDELSAALSSVQAQPLIYQVIHGAVRRAMTRRFPYAIYFIVDGYRIFVLRVLHQARDPDEWPAA